MSQATTWSVPLVGPTPPTVMATRMDDSLDALLSFHSGPSRPAYAVAGTIWCDTSSAGTHRYYQYDGADDNLLLTLDTATGVITWAQAVGYGAAQGLTVAQKEQALVNIGAFSSKVVGTITGNYTVTTDDIGAVIEISATAANRVVTLPSAAAAGSGFNITVRKSGTGFNTVTFALNGADTMQGTAFLCLPGQTVTIMSAGGSIWRVIAESGTVFTDSNANGTYLRHANGQQECWISGPGAVVATAAGAIFTSAVQVWTYPAAFVTPGVSGSINAGTTTYWANGNFINGNDCSFRLYASASSGSTVIDFRGIARGKWY